MNGRIITLGEIMLRLSPPNFERLLQSPTLEANFGGGESNTAVSLAQFGLNTAFITALPNNPIGEASIRFLRSYGVDTSLIQRHGHRIGIYFLEAGTNQRPSKVVYDRANSAMATISADCFDWNTIFEDASWLHITGITPAISQSAADLTLTAVQAAHAHNITISCDTSYRSKLWQYGKAPIQVMPHILKYVNVLFANKEDCHLSYGVHLTELEAENIDETTFNQQISKKMFATFPQLRYQIFTHREGFSASHNAVSTTLYNGRLLHSSRRYNITHIVDRIGGGDALAAGIIYGLHTGMSDQETIEFAAAAACLKHTIPGDVNLVSLLEVKQLMEKDASARVQR